ncbi:N-acetyltransferase [Nocardioides psychrotolerans]|uniref:Predicted N-acetyltransferase YhbS n=1 Tax=Nocardioides psychrotolerans TaxID=1005945 RepID=A0A1I3EW45_9ACTN|nr:GNAT family N-acetyltransferase [Nocardioides psychrotolerans]GEP39111.1 N-acetyltransferase [Nocardioides psychrotolerans]SFI03177.1 Predicted N-acetyltransferase YhbS [Nocardioides psychrotolerans]
MLLRLATPEDHEVVGRATVAAYSPFIGGERPDTGYVEQLRDAARRAEEADLWVACSADGAVLGSVTICPEGSPWRELARPGEGEFRMLAVDPAAQGQGVGRALVEHALAHFRVSGASGVVLCSMAEMTAAHALYGRLGFEREPALDWSPAPGVELLSFRLTFAMQES